MTRLSVPPHKGKGEAEETGNPVQRKSPLGCRIWRWGSGPAYRAGIPQLLDPGVLVGYEQSHSSTGDAGHAAGCSGIARCSAGNLCFSWFPLNIKVLGITIPSTLTALSWDNIPGMGMCCGGVEPSCSAQVLCHLWLSRNPGIKKRRIFSSKISMG